MGNEPSIVKPAVIGGVVAGVVSSIPILGMLNCCCCLLVIGGGFLAGMLHSNASKSAGVAFSGTNGATVGLLAGLFFGLTAGILGAIVQLIAPQMAGFDFLLPFLENNPDIPPELIDQIRQAQEDQLARGFGIIAALVGIVTQIIAGLIFCTLGGLLAGSVFKVDARPAEDVFE